MTLAMHKRLILGLLSAAAILAPVAATAQAQPPIQHSKDPNQNYIDPFAADGWEPSRTDMGVDWVATRPLPVLAIGNAVILGSDSHASWPGHRIIWYQLLDGNHAGDIVYVAEHLKHLIPVGTHVRAGQKIAVALPGYPYTEWGWADSYGSPRAYPCYHEGQQTRSGKEMARFMQSLGAQVAERPGFGIDAPVGKLC